MPVTRLDVRTADGVMDVHLHAPEGASVRPTVIFYPDAGGVRPVMHDMAERLASAGYLVALVNMFYRSGDVGPFDLAKVWSDPEERAKLMAVMGAARPDLVMQDTASLLDALAGQPGVRVDQVGTVGYCRGGLMAFTAAGAHPSRVAAAASIHGGGIATDDPSSPHLKADAIRARLYFGVADNDQSCTPAAQELLRTALDKAAVTYQLEQNPGVGHGYAVADNPSYDQAAADRHWDRVTALFAETLPTA